MATADQSSSNIHPIVRKSYFFLHGFLFFFNKRFQFYNQVSKNIRKPYMSNLSNGIGIDTHDEMCS